MKKLCVVTSTRADYGLLKYLCKLIRDHDQTTLQLIVTGTHLNPDFGDTVREIIADGFLIDKTINIETADDTDFGVSQGFAAAVTGGVAAINALKPDIVLLLGDRYEILAIAVATLIARVPLGHLHGGEITKGAFDDAMRHAITKLSDIHFVAAPTYKKRVIQMGESPERVFLVGGLGVDSIAKTKLLSKAEVEIALGKKLLTKNILVTFHPATLEPASAHKQISALLNALGSLSDVNIIFTLPNSDPDNNVIRRKIIKFCENHPYANAYASLGHVLYLSCARLCDGLVGNSSSGIAEAPTLKTASVNIGDRQSGRLKSCSVVDCIPEEKEIYEAIQKILSSDFKQVVSQTKSAYGLPGASKKIFDQLLVTEFVSLKKKVFFDIPF